MAQALIIIGASIFGILGATHLLYTFFTDKFNAYDSSVTEAMKGASPILTKETSIWNAWVGFNASHSFGAILVACFYIPLSVSDFNVIQQSVWFSYLPVIIGLSYLILAKRYWFKIPLIGVSISTVCFVLAAALINT
ncbi:hypothetical protein KFJ24_06130 [Marinobacter sediminum]|uniref:LIC_13387 family protein n=1 Tax=Marinobacter sediminum TaxID=256323 RepID=UPI0020306E1F|nr:hypothetical protein [Marinobacter sediminum]MCM0612053.1 hypothetical protein [Marinobacter sediminum]